MRLSTFQVKVIKNTLGQVFGQSAQIYLFGSRVDDQKKGGDIDLFVDTNQQESLPVIQLARQTGVLL